MPENKHHVIKLTKNHLYPTYQLYATMASKKTSPQDGLRIAALTVMEWLRERLGEDVPPELQQPGPEAYASCTEADLPSLHINCGYVIDIVSLPQQGVWSLQITEPDLGPDPGGEAQNRPPVPGRVIETHIGFHITPQALECGFQTVIADPDGAKEDAEVYRLIVVGRLMRNEAFGLKQITRLGFEPQEISTVDQLKAMWETHRSDSDQLPTVVFTYAHPEPAAAPIPARPPIAPLMPVLTDDPLIPPTKAPDPLVVYDVETFAGEAAGFCRTYVLADALFERFVALSKGTMKPGDIVVLHPRRYGLPTQIFPYRPSKSRQREAMDGLRELILSYPRRKEVAFGGVAFLTHARDLLVQSADDAIEGSKLAEQRHEEGLSQIEEQWAGKLAEREQACQLLAEQLERQKAYAEQVEAEKAELQKRLEGEIRRYKAQLHEEDEYTEFLERKLDRPTEHSKVAAWVEKYFSDRLILHSKAVALLEDRSAQTVDLGLICDALDYLATDYWEQRYLRIPEEVAMARCSKKYGRPFNIKPTGMHTVEFAPKEYKIKYFEGAKGKPVETPLDYHLGVGNTTENLLRIYFLHDDEKKRIVVGSLPRHLTAVSIK